jgi:hypothetical protein
MSKRAPYLLVLAGMAEDLEKEQTWAFHDHKAVSTAHLGSITHMRHTSSCNMLFQQQLR